jgi:hypothetical protein
VPTIDDPFTVPTRHWHRLDDGRVLDTLRFLEHETDVWFEITTLLIPGRNDSDAEIDAETSWIADALGPDVPVHFTAFHPDYKMLDVPHTPPSTLSRARRIAQSNGLRFVYTGNVHDPEGGTTYCPGCGDAVVVRDWYAIGRYRLDEHGGCRSCGTPLPGVFDGAARGWGAATPPGPHRRALVRGRGCHAAVSCMSRSATTASAARSDSEVARFRKTAEEATASARCRATSGWPLSPSTAAAAGATARATCARASTSAE